jgi:hypothetical protein
MSALQRLISPSRLKDEARSRTDRERNRYVDEIPSPSVITFNTTAAAHGATDFMLMISELIDDRAPIDCLQFRPRER